MATQSPFGEEEKFWGQQNVAKPVYIGEAVEEKYNAVRNAVGSKLWQAAQQVAPSSFGKGALITAGLVIAAMVLTFAFGGYSGALHLPVSGGLIPATVEEGVVKGLFEGLRFLMHGVGLATVAIGGAIGAAIGTFRRKDQLTAEDAAHKAREYEQARQHQPQQNLQPARTNEHVSDTIPGQGKGYHCGCEDKRREDKRIAAAQNLNTAYRTL